MRSNNLAIYLLNRLFTSSQINNEQMKTQENDTRHVSSMLGLGVRG